MISDKQSIAELFKNHFVRLAEGVTQLDTEDYCEDFRDHPTGGPNSRCEGRV